MELVTGPVPLELPAELIDAIEYESAVLVRNLEMARRRSGYYGDVDRATYLLLRSLSFRGPSDISTLSTYLGSDPATTGRQVAAAHKAGLIERATGRPDHRRAVISITPLGVQQMESVREQRVGGLNQMLGEWRPEDLQTMSAMLRRYNSAIATHYALPDAGYFGRAVPDPGTSIHPDLPASTEAPE
jgi:DNA-binding MarR family transcriptional regulator